MNKRMISRRSFLGASAVAAGVLALSGCKVPNLSKPKEEEKPVNLQFVLDYVPNTNHTGIYVAKQKGFYKEVGLEVDVIQPPEDGADALVGAGKAQFGVGYQDIMANYLGSDSPLPITACAAILQHNTSGIMSAKASNITRPRDMSHHSYATWNIATEQAIVKSVVTSDGGDWKTVELVPCNTTDEVASLKAHEFDCVWVYEGWACQNAKLQDFAYNYFSFASYDKVFDYYTPVIIGNNDYMKQNPEVTKKFLAATAKGYQFAVEKPEEAANILCEAVPELDKKLVALSQKFLADYYIGDASQWGIFNADRWNAFYAWMDKNKLVQKTIPKDTGFTNEYLG